MLLPEGFPGQGMRVLPAPLVARLRDRPVTDALLVTDIGFFPAAQGHGRHRPDGSAELIVIVCTDGTGWCEVGAERFAVGPGQAVVVPVGVPHAYRSEDDDPWTIWWCHLTGTTTHGVVEALGGATVVRLRDPLRAAATLNRVLRRVEQDETYAGAIGAAADAWSLLSQLTVDHLAGDRDRIEPVLAARQHLRENLAEPLSVPELARLAGLSTSHFAALFRRATGTGVVDHLTGLRMARARELLDTTGLSIAEVAAQVGYPDPFYFTRRFRSAHGVTPSGYRARG